MSDIHIAHPFSLASCCFLGQTGTLYISVKLVQFDLTKLQLHMKLSSLVFSHGVSESLIFVLRFSPERLIPALSQYRPELGQCT